MEPSAPEKPNPSSPVTVSPQDRERSQSILQHLRSRINGNPPKGPVEPISTPAATIGVRA